MSIIRNGFIRRLDTFHQPTLRTVAIPVHWIANRTTQNGGSAPATPGFNAVAPEWLFFYGAAEAAPAVPAAETTLGSHPCVALSSAPVISEWINRSLAVNAFPANGDNPLNFVSHSRGSLHTSPVLSCDAPPCYAGVRAVGVFLPVLARCKNHVSNSLCGTSPAPPPSAGRLENRGIRCGKPPRISGFS